MNKLMLCAISAIFVSGAYAEEVPITGNVESKCVITTDTAGVYGNPTPSNLSTDPTDGGVTPIVRYDVSMAEYYKALITWPDEFSQSPELNDTIAFDGEVTVDRVSVSTMSDYESAKTEYQNSTEYELTESGSTWFAIESEADYGFSKAFPGGTYRSLITAECIAQ
jgi:hypothetical protein